MMTQYRGIPLGELSPHAYAIAEQVLPGPSLLPLSVQSGHVAPLMFKSASLSFLNAFSTVTWHSQTLRNDLASPDCRHSMP